LNYFSKCYEKALDNKKLPSNARKEASTILKNIEEYRKLIEKEYVTSI
jgi:hypothetical protein